MSEKKYSTFRNMYRLLSYTKRYWLRLSIGIFAGMIVGGSLFVTLMMIPQLVGVIKDTPEQTATVNSTAAPATVNGAVAPEAVNGAAAPEAVNAVAAPATAKQDVLADDPQLAKILRQAASAAEAFNLPFSVDGTVIHVRWPKEFSFDVINDSGRVAWQLFCLYAVLFVLVWGCKSLAHYINGYCTRWVSTRVVADLREDIFRKLTSQSLGYYGSMDTGQLISRCNNDTAALEYSVSHCVEDLTNAPLQIIGCVAAIFIACRESNNYMLLLIIAIIFPVALVPINILGRKIHKHYRKSYKHIADVTSCQHETFSGIKAVKAYNTEDYENARFHQTNRKYYRKVISAIRWRMMISPLTEVVVVIASMIFLLYGYNEGVPITLLVALLAPIMMAYRPIKDLSKVIAGVQQSMAAADRVFELLDTDHSLPEKPDAYELTGLKEGIELKNVVFSYDGRKVIDNVSFSIPRGSIVAVVGETGSGKTTIANLIARLYDVTSGSVTFDGHDVRDCSISSLRRLIGVVNQEPIIFNDTIKANIAYGSPDASDEDIIKAAKLANAHEFIINGAHEDGYDSIAGENGFKLSGGEKQRITIARAILRNPPVLILDEATSALDNVTERLVQDALNHAMQNRTVFVIAHRLSTIQHADKIIVLKQGKIAEMGSHDELLAENGIYRKLHDTQFNR